MCLLYVEKGVPRCARSFHLCRQVFGRGFLLIETGPGLVLWYRPEKVNSSSQPVRIHRAPHRLHNQPNSSSLRSRVYSNITAAAAYTSKKTTCALTVSSVTCCVSARRRCSQCSRSARVSECCHQSLQQHPSDATVLQVPGKHKIRTTLPAPLQEAPCIAIFSQFYNWQDNKNRKRSVFTHTHIHPSTIRFEAFLSVLLRGKFK